MSGVDLSFLKLANHGNTANFAVSRSALLPILSLRRSRMEDCDDVLPLLNRYEDKMNEYQLSHILEPSDGTSVSYVAEIEGKIRAFIQLSTAIDIAKLNEAFETENFNGFQLG